GREALHRVQLPGGVACLQRRQLGRPDDLAAPAREPGDGRDAPVPAATEPVHAPVLVLPEIPPHPALARDGKGGHGVPERGPDDWVRRALRARGHAGPGALPADVPAPRALRADRRLRPRRRELDGLLPIEVPPGGVRVPPDLLQARALYEVLPLGADPPDPDLQVHDQRPRVSGAPADPEVALVARRD